jgi:hypothetical protein
MSDLKNEEYFQKQYGKNWLGKWNGYKKQIKNKKTTDSNGNRRSAYRNQFDEYRDKVKQLTENNIHDVPNSDKRGFHSYQVDHKISIRWGYDNGILEEYIAHPSNLEMVWWKDNIRKGYGCKVDADNDWILKP